jgi:hypothetical protein
MHTALVQRLLRDRSAWELANRAQLAPEQELMQRALQTSAA